MLTSRPHGTWCQPVPSTHEGDHWGLDFSQTCANSNATALRNTKSQACNPKCIYRTSKHPKHPQRTYRLQAYYNLRILTKLIAGSTPPLHNMKSPPCQSNFSNATWYVWPLKSRPLQLYNPRPDCCALQAIYHRTSPKGVLLRTN